MKRKFCRLITHVAIISMVMVGLAQTSIASEVNKGEIPADQLNSSFKQLPWQCPVWDVEEAAAVLKKGEKALWVDTRPESFFKAGTVRGAVLLPYNKKGLPDNELTAESLAAAIKEQGLEQSTAKIIMFCQGPKCHRSYNGTYAAVTEWGYEPQNVVWFRSGYPLLLKAVKGDAKMKRKAKKYLSDEGVKAL